MLKEKINKIKKDQEELKRIINDTLKLSQSIDPNRRCERLNRCIICLEVGQFNNIMIARECGHGGICSNCVIKGHIKKCPTCRTKTSFIKLFI